MSQRRKEETEDSVTCERCGTVTLGTCPECLGPLCAKCEDEYGQCVTCERWYREKYDSGDDEDDDEDDDGDGGEDDGEDDDEDGEDDDEEKT